MIIPTFDWDKSKERTDTFGFLFESYHLSLLAVARHFVSSEVAEDIIQDVFLRLWEKRKEVEHIELLPFLKNIKGKLSPILFKCLRMWIV